MSDTIGSPLKTAVETVREAYSFACLNCGYGWEQAYDIEHHVAKDGHIVFEYKANGVRVPSPLKEPACPGCGGQKVRIMRAGRVATAGSSMRTAPGYAPSAEPADAGEPVPARLRRRWFAFFSRRAD